MEHGSYVVEISLPAFCCLSSAGVGKKESEPGGMKTPWIMLIPVEAKVLVLFMWGALVIQLAVLS